MIAAITGIGWVTPESMGSGRHYQMLQPKDGKLPKLTSRVVFGRVSLHFGRLDEYSKLGLAAVAFALKDAKQDEGNEKRPSGIIVSTVHGCLATDMDYFETVITYGGNLASPNLFACTLPNIFLGEAAIRFGLTGPGFAVNEPQLKGVNGLALALCSMSHNDCQTMLVGTCDLGRPEFLPDSREVTPGALFFVLEKHPCGTPLPYGGIDMTTEGGILFKGAGVQCLEELFTTILSSL